jgi:kinesin family member C1
VRDLLSGGDGKCEVKKMGRDDDDIVVTDLAEFEVTDEAAVTALLARAAANRAVAKTDMNERSSRSHSVFRLRLLGHNPATGGCMGVRLGA